MDKNIYELEVQNIDGTLQKLSSYKGQVLLIVNTASKCGFTSQYEGLEDLYEKHKDKGFTVLGFPCNQFGSQEPGSDEEISQFCETKFSIKFPMFSKIDVNGDQAHPLFQYLKSQAPGLLGTQAIKWNFTKFLVDRNGQVVQRFAPKDKPSSLEESILKLL